MSVTPAEPGYHPLQSISYSSATLHRQCPQAWNYRYVQGYERTGTAIPLELGSWWHLVRALDSIGVGWDRKSLLQAPRSLSLGSGMKIRIARDPEERPVYQLPNGQEIHATADYGLGLAAAWWRTLTGDAQEPWLEALGEPLPDRLMAMESAYQLRWASERDNELPLLVEAYVSEPLAVPTIDGGEPTNLTGIVDLVYLDTRRNLIVARDHKTGGTLPAADAADDLSDSQLHLYAWALNQSNLLPDGRKVGALSYDRVRTAKPKEPQVTASGTLSKSVTDYDLDTYLGWAAGPDGEGVPWGAEGEYFKTGKNAGQPKFGRYRAEESVLSKLSTESARSVWHQRTLTPLNSHIVASHLRATTYTAGVARGTLAMIEEAGEAPRNFSRWTCGRCDYRSICQAQLTGGPTGEYPLDDFGLVRR